MKQLVLTAILCLTALLVMAEDHRSEESQLRDQYRHPQKTLDFFEIKANHSVVEIWPGGGWYSEILAPRLKNNGQLYAAHFPNDSKVAFFRKSRIAFEQKITNNPDSYGSVTVTDFEPPSQLNIAPVNSVDRVLTFRNVHNWMRNDSEQVAFNAFFRALKPGGMLGVVEHRAPDSFNLQQMVDSGYVGSWYVMKLAKKAGFILVGQSEINANKKDNKTHINGVWTLPPTLRVKGDENIQRAKGIGESDRMTLKFLKPQVI
ncbi:MAG: methyltransferase [Bermanella sp.]